MKKLAALTMMAALAACGGEEQKAKAPAAAQAMNPGQWQSTLEVTSFRIPDGGTTPRIDMPVGTRAQAGACIGTEDTTRPPPELFVPEGFESCRWGNDFYMRGGRLTSALACRHNGIPVEVTVNGEFTATNVTGTVQMITREAGPGDINLAARIEGRHSGACTPGNGEGAGNNQSQTK